MMADELIDNGTGLSYMFPRNKILLNGNTGATKQEESFI